MVRLLLVLLVALSVQAKDVLKVDVIAVHSVTHNDQDVRAMLTKGILGAHAPSSQSESFNLDAVINGEHVILVCEDPKGCEAPALSTYDAEIKRQKFVKMSFPIPPSQKQVSRWYKIAGSW